MEKEMNNRLIENLLNQIDMLKKIVEDLQQEIYEIKSGEEDDDLDMPQYHSLNDPVRQKL